MSPALMFGAGRRDRRAVPAARALVALLVPVALGACSGPELSPTRVAPPEGVDDAPVIPAGGVCAPSLLPAQPAEPELDEAIEPLAECDAPSPHTPLQPLGVGYREIDAPLPDGVAYLTFDDGPSEWTLEFLDILASRGVKATFFVTSKQFKGPEGLDGTYVDDTGQTIVFRDVLARIVADGHLLGNHTVNHADIGRITRAQMTSEIEQNELLVNRALLRAGSTPRLLPLFRPPYGSPWFSGVGGETPPQASERISSHGLNILWNISSSDAADWAIGESYSRTATPIPSPNPPSYAEKVARLQDSVLASPQFAGGEGIIVLMHDTHNTTRDALPAIIDGLLSAGYAFETIEHYVDWRWGRPSMDLTPGPALYQRCVEERNWGCASFGAPAGEDRALEVCGRMWVGYEALGGEASLGLPIAAPVTNPVTGIVSQEFEQAVVELHPENEAPCNVVAIPR